MYRRLHRLLEIHKVLYSLQFGFQESHLIDHPLLSLTEAVRNILDNKIFGCGILIDLEKALIQLIIELRYQNWNTMLFVDVPLNGLDHIYLIKKYICFC